MRQFCERRARTPAQSLVKLSPRKQPFMLKADRGESVTRHPDKEKKDGCFHH